LKNSAENDAIRGGNMASETKEKTQAVPAQPRILGVTFKNDPHPTRIIIDLPPEAAMELDQIMLQTGDDITALLQKSLALYRLAKEAIRDGKSVGTASDPESLETQFVGL
jgi:hypothetical protein